MLLEKINRILELPLLVHGALAIGSFAGLQWVKGKLDASYLASKHPVDFATGQTGFSGEKVKEYYAHMSELGTLDIYRTTQLIDFGFIAAMFGLGLFACTLIARLGRPQSWARRIGLFAGLSLMAGALCDASENAVSFIMLANPNDFANWIALPYSGFAVAKFGLITLGMLAALVSLVLGVVGRGLQRQT